jgi:hypothetical protein
MEIISTTQIDPGEITDSSKPDTTIIDIKDLNIHQKAGLCVEIVIKQVICIINATILKHHITTIEIRTQEQQEIRQ